MSQADYLDPFAEEPIEEQRLPNRTRVHMKNPSRARLAAWPRCSGQARIGSRSRVSRESRSSAAFEFWTAAANFRLSLVRAREQPRGS